MIVLKKVKNKVYKIYLEKKFRYENKHNFMRIKFAGGKPRIDNISVGNMSYGLINAYQFGENDGNLIIGNFCSIADYTLFLFGGEHRYNFFTTYPCHTKIFKDKIDSYAKGDIIIEDDVWIGNRATILSGVKISTGAIVAAGAVVTKDIEPYAIYGGVPAKKIGMRFSNNIIEELLKIEWKKVTPDKIKAIQNDFDSIITINNVKEIVEKINK